MRGLESYYCSHERPEFGCEACIRKVKAAQHQAMLDNAPERVVSFEWSVQWSSSFTAKVRVPTAWPKDEIDDHLLAVFDGLIGQHVDFADLLTAIQYEGHRIAQQAGPTTVDPDQLRMLVP